MFFVKLVRGEGRPVMRLHISLMGSLIIFSIVKSMYLLVCSYFTLFVCFVQRLLWFFFIFFRCLQRWFFRFNCVIMAVFCKRWWL